jgi:hypothetical protein
MHAGYVEYIGKNSALPDTNYNNATRHPPLFYIGCALFYKIGVWLGGEEPLEYARYFSMILYLGFIVFGALTIRLLFAYASHEYYIALALLAFWPVGVTKIGVMQCDLLVYISTMAVIYFLLEWLKNHRADMLSAAFVASGFAVLAKNSGTLMMVICMAFLGFAIYKRRKVFSWKLLLSIAFTLLCTYSTLNRPTGYDFQYSITHQEHELNYAFMFLYFNPYEFINSTMINPHNGEPVTAFWPYFLRSVLLGDYIYWKSLAIVWVFGIVWLSMIVYILHGLWKQKRFPAGNAQQLRFILFMAALLVSVVLAAYSFVIQPTQIADARYIYPIVCIIAVFYAKVMEWHRLAGRDISYKIGNGMALSFVFLTVCLFLAQDYLLTKVQ